MGKYGKTMSDSYQEVLEWTVTAHELQEKKKVSKREIDKLEDGNEHGMVALKLAQSFGTPKEVKTVQDINKRHNRAGSIEHKDQKERDAIIRKYYDMAEVYEIGTKEYADHTKNMTPGQTVDEGKMKDIVTDVKDALGKIRHRVSQKGSKFIVSVDSNDEEDAQKAMKNHPLYVAGKLRVIPEETELDEKFKVGDKVKVKKGTMGPTQRHYEKTVGTIIKDYKDGDFKVNFGGYDNLGIDGKLLVKEEIELDEALSPQDKKVVDTFYHTDKSMTGKILKTDGKTLEKIGMGAQTIAKVIPQSGGEFKVVAKMDGRSTQEIVNYIKKTFPKQLVTYEEVELDEVTMTKALNIDPKDVDRMKVLTVLYTRALKLPSGSPLQDKIKKEITKLRKQLGMNEAIEQKLDEMFDYVLLDKDNKIVGRYSGKDAKKNAESGKKSAHLPPMRIPKGEVSKMKVYPINPKDKKGIGDMVLAIGEEVELTEKVSKDLAIKILSMNKNQKFAKISGDYVPEIYLSSSDKDSLKKEFGKLPRGLPSASSGIPVVDFINYALGLDNEIDTEGDGNAPKLYDYRKGKVIGKPKTVGDAAKIAGVKLTEKKLTDAEMKKREEIAKAIEKDDPDMPMDKKMAIATATAKRVAEEEEPDKPDTAKQVDQMRDDKKKTRIAQLQLQIAKATETINKLNTQEK